MASHTAVQHRRSMLNMMFEGHFTSLGEQDTVKKTSVQAMFDRPGELQLRIRRPDASHALAGVQLTASCTGADAFVLRDGKGNEIDAVLPHCVMQETHAVPLLMDQVHTLALLQHLLEREGAQLHGTHTGHYTHSKRVGELLHTVMWPEWRELVQIELNACAVPVWMRDLIMELTDPSAVHERTLAFIVEDVRNRGCKGVLGAVCTWVPV